ncbi:MAG: 7-carboxy-7-deazaguanine synthase QueE [Geobacteraceae bacterium]|nr:7-carboxy-7-deazaguanine synthase QueE [Geobacteraceae bacterium]
MSNSTANLIELFSSIQGEGSQIGLRQVFIRFFGCNLSCEYCDTNVGVDAGLCRIEQTPGRADFKEIANPVDMNLVLSHLQGWVQEWPKVHHSISLTGGEPLLHLDTLHRWLPELRLILPVHLETNGVLHFALSRVISDIDYISMDIKLPSSSGEIDLWEHHRQFLEVAVQAEVSVKIVVNSTTELWEIERTAGMIAAVDCNIPLIIQPETADDLSIRISTLSLLELQEVASLILPDVRIIPQTHRFIGLL